MAVMFEIRTLNVESIDLDEAVEALTWADTLKEQYAKLQIPVPDWLTDKWDELSRNVKARHRDYLERALKVAKAKRDAFKSREEKSREISEEIAKLEKALA